MPTLSPRQTQMLTLLAQGYSVKMASRALGISACTGKQHVFIAMLKLDAHTATQAVAISIAAGIIPACCHELTPTR